MHPLAGLAAGVRIQPRPRASSRACAGGWRSSASSSTPTSTRWLGMVDGVGFSIVQLHGDEGPAYCAEVARRTGAKVIKAAPIRLDSGIQPSPPFQIRLPPARRLCRGPARRDRHHVRLAPGERAAHAHPDDPQRRAATRAPGRPVIAATEPFAVDSASGTEASPGVKDPVRTRPPTVRPSCC